MDYIALGHRIRWFRVKKHLTQERLAEKAGISASFMGHVERGSRIVSLGTLMKLCAALDVTPNDLLGDDLAAVCADLPDQVTISSAELLRGIALLLRGEKP